MRNVLRLAACATHPIQYQAPIWRRLAAENGVEFEAFFGTDMSVRGYTDREFGTKVAWDTPLAEGYVHTYLSTDPKIQKVGTWSPGADKLGAHLRRLRPDVVLLTAYSSRFHFGAWRGARAAGAKIVMRHEASDVAAARSRFKSAARDLVLRQLYRRVDQFAVIGSEARRHLRRLGVPEARMAAAPYCVDTDFFAGEATRWLSQRERLRKELGIAEGEIAVAFSGKLVPKKDPLLVVRAMELVPEGLRKRMHWLVAGDGEMRAAAEGAARSTLGGRAHFPGFMNQSQIGRVYAAADVLVLPSRRGAGETWGLVVNEAMQFGLPALVSDGVGCAPDLITPKTGGVFPAGDVATLAGWFVQMAAGQCGFADRQFIQAAVAKFSTGEAAKGILAAARKAASL